MFSHRSAVSYLKSFALEFMDPSQIFEITQSIKFLGINGGIPDKSGIVQRSLLPKSGIKYFFSQQVREFRRFSEYSVRCPARTVHGVSRFAVVEPVH